MKISTTRNFILSLAVVMSLVTLEGGASASNKADEMKLTMSTSCANCDLSGAAFNGFNLFKKDLSNSKLAGTKFINSNMKQAVLKGAVIDVGTDFTGAQMSGAIWIDGSTCDQGAVGKGNKKPVKP